MKTIPISEWHKQDFENMRILRDFKSSIPHKPEYWQVWMYSEYKAKKEEK